MKKHANPPEGKGDPIQGDWQIIGRRTRGAAFDEKEMKYSGKRA